jgi:hypothetical protein
MCSLSQQPQLAGVCQSAGGGGSQARCDFSNGGCPSGETCQTGGGCPKYGDYNGIACTADSVIAAWASATPPLGVTAPSPGINIFADVITEPEPTPMLYRAKFVCGQPVGNTLAPGRYFTVINVHNPIEDASAEPVSVTSKFAVALPQQGHTEFGNSFDLASDDVREISCGEIIRAAGGVANLCSASFCEGFVVLESQAELDVTAVYTAAALNPTQQVTTLHTDRVAPHCPLRTEVLPERTVLFVPPKEGGGDADYAGHGPCIDFRLALQLEDGDQALATKYRMHAFECDGDFGKPRADFTSARGEEEIVLKAASPRGRILGHNADTSMIQQYIDTNHSDDAFLFDPPNPVKSLRFVGDTAGDEAGTRTGVFITFREMRVELETCAPPNPSP